MTFTLARAEFFTAWRRLQLRHRRTGVLPAVGVVFLVLGAMAGKEPLIVLGALLTLFLLCLYVMVPRSIWRRAEKGEQTHTLSVDGVQSLLPHAHGAYDWEYFRAAMPAGNTYMLQLQRGFIMIPRRAFASDDDEQRFLRLTASLWPA